MIGDDEGDAFDQAMRKAMAGIPDPVDSVETKRKRKSSTSPTQRCLAELRKRGWSAGVVERWIPRVKKRIDLFGAIDLVAIVPSSGDWGAEYDPGGILGIQACRDGDHATHRDKIIAEPRARQWVAAGGRQTWKCSGSVVQLRHRWLAERIVQHPHPPLLGLRGNVRACGRCRH